LGIYRKRELLMWEPESGLTERQVPVGLYVSVALVSMAVLMLEIGMTRVFSIMFNYHYVFLLISLAILGLGAGGIYVHYRLARSRLDLQPRTLQAASALMALATAAATMSIVTIPLLRHPLLAALVTFFPFFFAGIFLSAAFRLFPSSSGRLYAADLVGAAMGALLIVPLLKLGGINVGLLAAFIGAFALSLLMTEGDRGRIERAASFLLIVGLFGVISVNLFTGFLGDVPMARGGDKEMMHFLSHSASPARVVGSRWSAFGRTDLVAYEDNPDEMDLFIDGTAGTTMYRFDGDPKSLDGPGLTGFSGYFPLDLLPENEKEKVLIIGAGGGREVLISLLAGAEEITAVEVNRDLVDIVRSYSDFNGGIYNGFPGVRVEVEEGRNFIRRAEESYDVIMLVIPVTKTTRSPEGFALTENFLFTVESISDYLDHLNPNGRLVVVAHDDMEIYRLLFTSLAAMKTRGLDTQSAMNHMYAVGPDDFPVFVLKNSPITPEEAGRIHEKMHEYGYATHTSFIPQIEQKVHRMDLGDGEYVEKKMLNDVFYLLAKGKVSPEDAIGVASFEIRPVTDDGPFFYKFHLGMPPVILLLLIFSSIAMGMGYLITPVSPADGGATPREPVFGDLRFVLLFSLLGVGFMLVEIPLIQRFTLFLGQPIYAIAVLLFSLLIGAGAGSWVGGSLWKRDTLFKLRVAAMMVGILAGAYVVSLNVLFGLFLGAPLQWRIVISFVLVLPLGFFMGMPFPQGLKLLAERNAGHAVPRMWAINGIGSVLGSALAIALAMKLGFSYAMGLGAVFYLSIPVAFSFGFSDARAHRSVTVDPIPDYAPRILGTGMSQGQTVEAAGSAAFSGSRGIHGPVFHDENR
jgi:predicted membrane-bound spermidine synthase